MSKIVGIGETVLDILFKNKQPIKAVAGGSVFNAMVSLARVGINTEFVSEVGNDAVGNIILSFMKENRMSAKFVSYCSEPSSLSLAFLDENNNAEYQFYKHRPKSNLELENPTFIDGDALLFGSFYALNSDTRLRLKNLVDEAERRDVIVFYDPNFRKSHLEKRVELLPVIEENMRFSSIVRGSDEDFYYIFNEKNADVIYEKYIAPICKIWICTCGANGVWLYTPTFSKHFSSEKIEPVSTVGAGDNFNAGLLFAMQKLNIRKTNLLELTPLDWQEIISCAIAFSIEVCRSTDNYIGWSFAEKVRHRFS